MLQKHNTRVNIEVLYLHFGYLQVYITSCNAEKYNLKI